MEQLNAIESNILFMVVLETIHSLTGALQSKLSIKFSQHKGIETLVNCPSHAAYKAVEMNKCTNVKTSIVFLSLLLTTFSVAEGASWCVARSDASNQALQTALDYACASGADCTPLQSDGLCFLPNTIQAHASYAFNSYYQRRAIAPGSCDFAGTATVAKTDPSYGSCMYPSSLSSFFLTVGCYSLSKESRTSNGQDTLFVGLKLTF
ncbi:hypothetical protein GOBAR_DD05063 [Gossypium barbadense]|nr:hypothetical protein GOBAR_DD05063 [Gossypium barbadense]